MPSPPADAAPLAAGPESPVVAKQSAARNSENRIVRNGPRNRARIHIILRKMKLPQLRRTKYPNEQIRRGPTKRDKTRGHHSP